MKTSSFRNKIKEMLMMAVLLISIASCNDDPIVKDYNYDAFTPDGSLNFCITVPDYALPTRVTGDAEDIDTTITTLHLYLFDEKGGFIGIVEADKDTEHDSDKNLDPGEKDKVIGDDTKNATGYYKANIPQNTDIIHFVANAPQAFTPGYFDLNRHKGMREEEVFLPMLTTDHIYWGTSTYNELTTRPNPVVLYRNYAKVRYRLENQSIINNTPYIIQINGWKLCNVPQNSLVAPYDGNASTQPFHFNLTDSTATGGTHRYAAVPAYNQRKELLTITPLSATATSQVDNTKIVYTDNQEKALPIFDHSISAYSDFLNDANESKGVGDARVFAIFHITTAIYDGSNTTYEHKFYKILFMKNVDDGASQTFDIKRNHIYTIRFEGINPDLGWDSFDEAVAGPPANASEITVEETLPEVQSSNATLRVVNGTVRYIDNLEEEYMPVTDNTSLYNVNDIHIYYSGTETAAQQAVSDVLEVAWVSGSWVGNTDDEEKPESSSIVCKYTPFPDGTYSHTISFNADAFNYGDNGKKYYKEGLIRVTEKLNDGVLSRYIRVYIGEPVPFRPLLISSDIPSMSDERITVAFTVPDSLRLPTTLYPIEIRFGSDQVDVEKNLYTESMKVDLVSTAYEDNLLQYTNVVDGITQSSYGWYANGQAGDNWTDWGYKYTYTIEEPADSGEHRITLRTVYDDMTDFSVVMEGLSTVLLNGMGDAAKADIFNTRELKFNVLQEKTMATARRIMLDDGLYDTRLTSAYVNINKSDGATSVNIPYTLGYYDPNDEDGDGDYMTPATLSTGVNLWVYYRPEDLTPSGTWATLNSGKPFVDAEGNHFAKIENTTNNKGTLTFTFTDNTKDVKNSLVFITARSGKDDDTGTHPYGGTYTGAALGAKEHVYTGVNAETNAWRSASALVSVLSDWKFNPAPTEIADYNFEYADEMERNYGVGEEKDKTDYDFLVRIDRPTGTSGIKLSINTGGNLQLIEQVGVSKYTLETGYYEEGTETWNEVSTTVHRSKADANGDIHLTLTDDQSPYCVLRFRPLHYDHSGTITFEDISTTAIYNNGADNTLKITHSPLTIIDHKYMWRDDYMLIGDKSTTPDDIAETMVADANFYENFRVDANTAGQEFVARLYFPNSVKERMSDKDENGQELTFSFLFAGIGAKVIEPTGAGYSNYYTVDEETGKVTVTKLISGTSQNGVNTSQAFVDIFLRTNEDVSTENFRITSGDDLLFYRYTLGEFSTRTGYIGGGGKVKYEIAYTDQNPTWVELVHGKTYFNSGNEDPSYDNIFGNSAGKLLSSGRNFYLKASFTDWTEGEKVNLTITTSGFRTEQGDKPTNSTLTVSPEDDTHLSYKEYTYHFNNLTLDANKSVTIKLKTEDQGIADYLQVDARTDISDDNTDRGAILSKSAFIMAAKAGGEPQEWELYYNNASDKEGTNKDIFDIGAPIGSVQMLDDKYPIQINNQNSVSFYVPYDGVDLTVWAADDPNTTNAGNYAIYKVSYNDSQQAIEEVMLHNNPSVSSTAELQKDTYTLGTAGLYRIQAIDSPAYLYYIGLKKVKTAGQLGTTSWTAKRLDNSTKANATWSGSFNDDAEYITLSAFAEKLTLTFPNIQEEPFNMRLWGDDFRFLTPDGLVTELTGLEKTGTLTIVPTNGGVLEHLDKIQLDGESNNYFYKQDITLKLRPYVKLTHNLGTFETVQIDGETNAQLSVGKEVTFTFTYMDNSIVTETAQFRLSEWRDSSDVQNDFFTATSPAGWNKGDSYTLSSPKVGDVQTFNLKATKAGGTVFQAGGTASCDVYSGDTLKGSFFPTGKLDNIYPKIHITGVSITYDWGSYTDAEGQLPKDSVTGSGAEYTLPAKNFTLYKEGYTLTGWRDGTTTHALGAILENITSNVTLTPVFTQNTVSLDDRTEEVTIKWDFQRNNGAPTINGWEGTDGHVWVAQATVTNGSTTRTIDVKMDVNTTNGKFANASWGNWCQLNNGTILTIPSCTGATVEMNAHNKISTTTINGETGYTAGNTITATVSGSDATTDIVIDDGSYYSYVQVTLPVVEKEVNIIPTTDSNPFDLEEMTLLYDTSKNQASAKGEKEPAYREGHLDYMANGDYAEYKVTNTENTAYRISFNTATPLENVTLTFTLYDEAGTQVVWSGTSQALEKNSNSSDWSTQIPGQILTNYLQEGSYKLRITFNKAGSTTTANLYSVSFTPIEYKIGLGTWASSAIYENITVTNLDNNAVIYSSGSSLSSSNWNTSTGLYGTNDYVAYSSQLELEDLKADGNYDANGATAVLDKVIETNNYQITCRAKKTGGSEGFLILFNYADDQNRKWWNIGGWSNKIQTVETWTVGSYANNVTQWATDTDPKIVASNIWYDITIKVQNGEFTGSCVPASIGAPYRFDCTFDGTTVNRMNTPVSQDASAVWALDGSIGTPTLTGGAFSNNNMTYENFTQPPGSTNETVDGVRTDYVTFAPSTAGTYTPITWSITPTTGLTFTPTRVSAKILRVGTDGGTVNVKVKNSDGKETTLASDIIPRRKDKNTVSGDTNEDPKHKDGNTVYDYIEYSVDASLATSNSFSFIIEVSIGSGKSVAISDVQIHGAVSGKLE